MANSTVIEEMAEHQFLPRYGFPIGLHRLRVIATDDKHSDKPRVREQDEFRLERQSLLALNEYIPGSQLVVGGRIIASHGLLKHWSGANLDEGFGLTGSFATCPNGHLHYVLTGDRPTECPVCSSPPGAWHNLLKPKHGFTTAAWDPPRNGRDVERIGEVKLIAPAVRRDDDESLAFTDFAGIRGVHAVYREAGELLVLNRGENGQGFAICTACGYADSERATGQGRNDLPRNFANHAPLTSTTRFRACWPAAQTFVLRNYSLAGREITDVLQLDISTAIDRWTRDIGVMWTLGYAFQRSGAEQLQVDPREIGVTLVSLREGNAILLFDNRPGGAGHVLELARIGRPWLAQAQDILRGTDEHHERCETACLECLLSFDAQRAMGESRFARREANSLLRAMLADESPEPPPADRILPVGTPPAARATEEERRERSSVRRRSGRRRS